MREAMPRALVHALHTEGDEAEGHPQIARVLADDTAADHGQAPLAECLLHGQRQFLAAVHQIGLQIHGEEVVELGGIAHHVGKADQRQPGVLNGKLPLQIQDYRAQFLRRDADLHQRHFDGVADNAGLHAPGDDQLTPLPLQFQGLGLDFVGAHIGDADRIDMGVLLWITGASCSCASRCGTRIATFAMPTSPFGCFITILPALAPGRKSEMGPRGGLPRGPGPWQPESKVPAAVEAAGTLPACSGGGEAYRQNASRRRRRAGAGEAGQSRVTFSPR